MVKRCQVRRSKDISGQNGLGRVTSENVISGQDLPYNQLDPIKSGQISIGQDTVGQDRSGQNKSGQNKTGQVKTGQIDQERYGQVR